MQHPVVFEDLSPQLAKILAAAAPPPIKMMAASGVAPLPPVDLLIALYSFSYDADPKLSETAKSTLAKMPEAVLQGGLEQLRRPEVLDGLALLLAARPACLEKLLLNKALLGETAAVLARTCPHEALLELIAGNETRLLACPAIIEALYHNKKARMSTVDRAVELAVHAGLELVGIPSYEQIKAAITGAAAATEPLHDDELHAALLEEEIEGVDEEIVASILEGQEVAAADADEEAKKKVESLNQNLARLNTSSKIRIATLGSASQRAVLIRDSNKLVVMAVIQSPGLRDSEVLLYTRYRSLPEEAVRYMARNREWTKHYTVKLNLVQNPRTPIEYALRFLPHLRTNDLRSLERDKNVQGAVAKAAKELRSKRSY